MGTHRALTTETASSDRRSRSTAASEPRSHERGLVDPPFRSALVRFAGTLSTISDLPPTIPGMGPLRSAETGHGNPRRRFAEARQVRSLRVLYRRDLCGGEKRGSCIGKTKRGNGSKLMAVADGAGVPLAVYTTSASPHEVTLVHDTLKERFFRQKPLRLIGDRAYDSDGLDQELAEEGIELISPHRFNRIKQPSQDGRPLRRYRRRWKIERLFAWLHNFRRISTRHDYYAQNYLAFVHLGCILILLRGYF
jgi:transposase